MYFRVPGLTHLLIVGCLTESKSLIEKFIDSVLFGFWLVAQLLSNKLGRKQVANLVDTSVFCTAIVLPTLEYLENQEIADIARKSNEIV